MKTKIPTFALIGLIVQVLAQANPTAGSALAQSATVTPAPANTQPIPFQNDNQMNRSTPDVSTNNLTVANTNGANGFGNEIPTNSSGINGMTNGVNGNPYANYTNPYANYTNPYANYTNPYWSDSSTNSSLNTNGLNFGNTNLNTMNGTTNGLNGNPYANTNWSNVNTNRHHWWKWW
jgi:hypothetical protein